MPLEHINKIHKSVQAFTHKARAAGAAGVDSGAACGLHRWDELENMNQYSLEFSKLDIIKNYTSE